MTGQRERTALPFFFCAETVPSVNKGKHACQRVFPALFALFALAGARPPASQKSKITRKSIAGRCGHFCPSKPCLPLSTDGKNGGHYAASILYSPQIVLYAKVYSREQMTIMREDYSPYPDTIVLRGAAAGSDGITVTWRTDPVAETYLVYRRSSPSGVWTSLTSTAVDGQYLDRKI
mgnify:FL=1